MEEVEMEEIPGLEEYAGPKRKPRLSKKRQHEIIAVIVLVMVVSAVLYYFVFPRTEADLKIWYNEQPGGTVNIAFEIRNQGTVAVEQARMDIVIANETGRVMANGSYYVAEIPFWGKHQMASIHIGGDELLNDTVYNDFYITVQLAYFSQGELYTFKKTYVTEEPYMNWIWEESIA